jgi:hypothetical protein
LRRGKRETEEWRREDGKMRNSSLLWDHFDMSWKIIYKYLFLFFNVSEQRRSSWQEEWEGSGQEDGRKLVDWWMGGWGDDVEKNQTVMGKRRAGKEMKKEWAGEDGWMNGPLVDILFRFNGLDHIVANSLSGWLRNILRLLRGSEIEKKGGGIRRLSSYLWGGGGISWFVFGVVVAETKELASESENKQDRARRRYQSTGVTGWRRYLPLLIPIFS